MKIFVIFCQLFLLILLGSQSVNAQTVDRCELIVYSVSWSSNGRSDSVGNAFIRGEDGKPVSFRDMLKAVDEAERQLDRGGFLVHPKVVILNVIPVLCSSVPMNTTR